MGFLHPCPQRAEFSGLPRSVTCSLCEGSLTHRTCSLHKASFGLLYGSGKITDPLGSDEQNGETKEGCSKDIYWSTKTDSISSARAPFHATHGCLFQRLILHLCPINFHLTQGQNSWLSRVVHAHIATLHPLATDGADGATIIICNLPTAAEGKGRSALGWKEFRRLHLFPWLWELCRTAARDS